MLRTPQMQQMNQQKPNIQNIQNIQQPQVTQDEWTQKRESFSQSKFDELKSTQDKCQ